MRNGTVLARPSRLGAWFVSLATFRVALAPLEKLHLEKLHLEKLRLEKLHLEKLHLEKLHLDRQRGSGS